ncbi:hypothetical protein BG006_001752 [Podila minutissima]|uniref:Protein kinase domain-containing protein n=1 Tax=Podila minutissima TaxID=64525 RepID=A0A9P5SR36_9FUNG|nr:hypothetical protein BG006_001752 [Podila minutissima]
MFHLTKYELSQAAIQREISVLQELRHRHIIQFYEQCEVIGNVYLVMDLAENGSLASAIEKGTVTDDWPTKIRLAHEVARGLEYMHQKKVIHRDLKSANVLLTKHMKVKLADFGLAAVRTPLLPSLQLDMYALGMVMWEMAASCTMPFRDQPSCEVVMSLVKDGEREMLPDDTPSEYREWVELCWNHDPFTRPDAGMMVLVANMPPEQSLAYDRGHTSVTFDDSMATGEDNDGLAEATSEMSLFRLSVINTDSDGDSDSDNPSINSGSSSSLLGEPDVDENLDEVGFLLQNAKRGKIEAQVTLISRYLSGDGFTLGMMHQSGRGTPQSDVEAVRWFLRAAELGDEDAQIHLASAYQRGIVISQDVFEAAKWYRKAADQGEARAQQNLEFMYQKGLGVEQSNDEAASWFLKAAKQGVAVAQYNLALMIVNGVVTNQSHTDAIFWYRKAAEQGHENAQKELGKMYCYGHGVEKNPVEGLSWFRKAAEQGDIEAQHHLGIGYVNGLFVQKNHGQAFHWLLKAAEQGHPNAQRCLGLLYEKGQGIERNDSEAVRWTRKAAEQGNDVAQLYLGSMYYYGQRVKQNMTEGVLWFRKAAEQGNTAAQYNLGMLYEDGSGAKKDLQEALKWYGKAAEQGEPDVMKKVRSLIGAGKRRVE